MVLLVTANAFFLTVHMRVVVERCVEKSHVHKLSAERPLTVTADQKMNRIVGVLLNGNISDCVVEKKKEEDRNISAFHMFFLVFHSNSINGRPSLVLSSSNRSLLVNSWSWMCRMF